MLLTKGKEYIRFAFHVDDGAYAQSGDELWSWYLRELKKKFDFTLAPLHYLLNINFEIDYEKGVLHLKQTGQIEKMARELGMQDAKTAPNPVPLTKPPTLEDAVPAGSDSYVAIASTCIK